MQQNITKEQVTQVLTQRGNEYGSYENVAMRVQDIKSLMPINVITDKRTKAVLELSTQMLAVKTARLINTPDHEDTKLDTHGYAKLLITHIESLQDKQLRDNIKALILNWIDDIRTVANEVADHCHSNARHYLALALEKQLNNIKG